MVDKMDASDESDTGMFHESTPVGSYLDDKVDRANALDCVDD